MAAKTVFISHATADDPVVKTLREKLEEHGYRVWADSRELTAGNELEASICTAIDDSSHVIVVLSRGSLRSRWVRKEVEYARGLAAPASQPGLLQKLFGSL